MAYDRRSFLAGLAAFGAGVAGMSRAHGADPDLLGAIAEARRAVRSLVARFRQERTLGLLASSVVSQGELSLVRPDRLRWELFPPDAITYWVTRSGVAYASAHSAASVDRSAAGPLGIVLSDLLTVLGGDMGSLNTRYAVRAERAQDRSATVVVAPTDPKVAKVLRRIELTLAPDLVVPKQIVLEESDTDRVRIDFISARLNVPVDGSKMSPPARR